MNDQYPKAQNPLILRFHRLLDAFAKSDDERDFYLDQVEGFLFFVDLDKSEDELTNLHEEIEEHSDRYCLIPKMTFYETKKFMEGFVNEKVYDIDTKEKLLDIIQQKEARENFIEFIYDHLTELEKWQQYYHERSRIRIIEWLRNQEVHFVFEEDLDIPRVTMEKVKRNLFEPKVPKDVSQARDAIRAKAKTYYSNEALNPKPKRGRPPKQAAKVETEVQVTPDMYMQVPSAIRHFLYIPETTSVTFSARFDTEAQLIASLRGSAREKVDVKLEALSQRLESLRHLSGKLAGISELDKEKGLFSAISKGTEERKIAAEAPKEGKLFGLVKGVLPKRRGADTPEEKPKPRSKKVTPLKRKPVDE